MIYFIALFLISGIAQASNHEEVEVCRQISKIQDVYYCDLGTFYAIHFKDQPLITIPKATPTPAPEVKKEGKKK